MKGWRILSAISTMILGIVALMIGLSSDPADVHAGLAGSTVRTPTASLVVTSTADSGIGTLRWALQTVSISETIVFDPIVFPPSTPATISLLSALPSITTNTITIDGSDAGVVLDGSDLPWGTNGLVIDDAISVTIKGLQILNFPGTGLILQNGAVNNVIGGFNKTPDSLCSGECNLIAGNGGGGVSIIGSDTMSNVVKGNYIGTNLSGTVAMGNTYNGVYIGEGATRNLVGGQTNTERNLISGNNGEGVEIVGDGTLYNVVSNNYIGANIYGTVSLGNLRHGVYIHDGASYTSITQNLISGNDQQGVIITDGNTMHNTVSGNRIGTSADGTTAIANAFAGVFIGYEAKHNIIGGDNDTPGNDCTGECNLISGNGSDGIYVTHSGTMSNTISGNYIGTNISGIAAIKNGNMGIQIGSEASYNIVGGNTASRRNLISGNQLLGIGFNNYAHHNKVQGNYIGTDATGTAVIGNAAHGVILDVGAYDNLIGGFNNALDGRCAGECNLISGNQGFGVTIQQYAMSNTVSGNYVGVDASGSTRLGNSNSGVHIDNGAQYNVIGGSIVVPGGPCSGECNLISGNSQDGVVILGNSTLSNTVAGNYIGTDVSGTAGIGNLNMGIQIGGYAAYNLIGGDTANKRNLISDNRFLGIGLNGGAHHNRIQGNYIGTDTSGTVSLGNVDHGIALDADTHTNLIGGYNSTPGEICRGECNLISGNQGFGVTLIRGTMCNAISGNYIGTNVSGTAALNNDLSGISISEGAQFNIVGGNSPQERNLISGNSHNGIAINGNGTISNTVSANYIGTDVNGQLSIANGLGGVDIRDGAQSNLVGGDTSGERNIISGNDSAGIDIWGEGTDHNVIIGNYIGTDAGGISLLGNTGDGLRLTNGPEYNIVGGITSGERNIISGNTHDGLDIGGAHNNLVIGNYIGTDASGFSALPNTERGIGINDGGWNLGTTYNQIEHNVISGNGSNGLDIWGIATANNSVTANYIGLDSAGSDDLGNGGSGIWVGGGAHDNLVGGAASQDKNIISGNTGTGVRIGDSGTVRNTVMGNYIGTNLIGTVALPNNIGIQIAQSGQDNVIGPNNLISYNYWLGIQISGNEASDNTITQNSIHSNSAEGIMLMDGGNGGVSTPVVQNWDLASGTVNGTACASCTIEVFSDDEDEGRIYEGTTVADAAGNWSLSKGSALLGSHVTATATDPQGNTSQFSIAPYMRVNRSHNWVDGQVILASAKITVTAIDAQGTIKGVSTTESDNRGYFWTPIYRQDGNWVNIGTGDFISITAQDGWGMTMEIAEMSGSVNVEDDSIVGNIAGASAGQTIIAEIWDLPHWPGSFYDTVHTNGNYAYHFEDFDIKHGHMIGVWTIDEQGNQLGIVRHWLRIETFVGTREVKGNTLPNATIHITATSGGIKGTGSTTSEREGYYNTTLPSESVFIPIMPGDRITVQAEDRTTSMTVATLTGFIDADADTVCGDGPPNAKVRIEFQGESSLWYDVDASGRYCAEFDFDLRDDHQGEVVFYDEWGHGTRAKLVQVERQAKSLTLGEPFTDSVRSLSYSDYTVNLSAGENMVVSLTPIAGVEEIWLYERLSQLPSTAQYDLRSMQPTVRGDYELLISPTRAGTYFLSAFGWRIPEQQGQYTILARTVDRYLSDVWPRSAGNAGEVTLRIQGIGMVEDVNVELQRQGFPTYAAGEVVQLSSMEISAHLDLTDKAPGIYDIVVIWPDSTRETIEGAFEIVEGGIGPHLEASLTAPEFVRPDRTFVLWVEYANTGDADMIPPLFIVSSPDGVPMRVSGMRSDSKSKSGRYGRS